MHYYYKIFIYIIIVIVNISVGIIGFQNDLLSSNLKKNNFSKKVVIIKDENEEKTKATFQIKDIINGFLNNEIIFTNAFSLKEDECILIEFSEPKKFGLGILRSYEPFELILIGKNNKVVDIILDYVSHTHEFISNEKPETKRILNVPKLSSSIKNIKIGDEIIFE